MQKTRTITLLLSISLVLYPQVHAMLAPAANTTLIHRIPHAPISGSTFAKHGTHPQQQSLKEKVLSQNDPVFQAVERGDIEAVKNHFEAWRYSVLPWQYYHQAVADVLEHAAKFAPRKTEAIVAYLIDKVSSDYIEHPDKLLETAIRNNHSTIVTFIDATSEKSINNVLRQAFSAFDEKLQPDELKSNIELIKKLFAVIPTDQHEAQLRKYLPLAPAHVHFLITYAVQEHLYPPRLHMVDDSSVGIADVDLFDDEPEARYLYFTQAVPDTTLSPLHQATLTGKYGQCIALLTTFKEPVFKHETLPLDALIKMRTPRQDLSDKDYESAVAKLAIFTAKMHRKIDQQFDLSHPLRTAKDYKGRTAYDIARAANAPAAVLNLLNPNDRQTMKQMLALTLETTIMDTVAAYQAQQAQAQRAQLQKIHEQLIKKQLQTGDKVYINGIEYTVVDGQKSK